MALHHDLLEQARRLAHHEPRRPKQASLRRAVSSAYYSLFHFVTEQAARRLVPGRKTHRRTLRYPLRRCFDHARMKRAAAAVANDRSRWHRAIGCSVSPELDFLACTFVALQEERHLADYDHTHSLLRSRVNAMIADVEDVEDAKAAWASIRGTPEADAYLLAVLLPFRS